MKGSASFLGGNGAALLSLCIKLFHLPSQRTLSQQRLQTASSERAMHILSNKKGQCIHYTISICASCRLNTLCSGHLVYPGTFTSNRDTARGEYISKVSSVYSKSSPPWEHSYITPSFLIRGVTRTDTSVGSCVFCVRKNTHTRVIF